MIKEDVLDEEEIEKKLNELDRWKSTVKNLQIQLYEELQYVSQTMNTFRTSSTARQDRFDQFLEKKLLYLKTNPPGRVDGGEETNNVEESPKTNEKEMRMLEDLIKDDPIKLNLRKTLRENTQKLAEKNEEVWEMD